MRGASPVLVVILLFSLVPTLAASPAGSGTVAPESDSASRPPYVRVVRVIELAELGLPTPAGFAYSPAAGAFLIIEDATTAQSTRISLLDPLERSVGALRVRTLLARPLNVAFDAVGKRLLYLAPGGGRLTSIAAGPTGRPDRRPASISTTGAAALGIRKPGGLAVDPRDGSLYILDSGRPAAIVQLASAARQRLDPATARRDGRLQRRALGISGQPQGLAFDARSGSFYTLVGDRLVEVGAARLTRSRDLSSLRLRDPRGMTFAPSGDPTDDPAAQSLYIADRGGSSGRIIELELTTTTRTALSMTSSSASLGSTIHTWQWSPNSPDPAGLAYDPIRDELVVADSEVDEMPNYYQGANLFQATRSGSLVRTATTVPWSREPTGMAVDPSTGRYFVSDDNQDKVFILERGPDGLLGTSDDVRYSMLTSSFQCTDPEGLAFGQGALFIADGLAAEVYRVDPGANGRFDGAPPSGDDVVGHFDTSVLGVRDPEGIEYDSATGTLFLIGPGRGQDLVQADTNGGLIAAFDLPFITSQGLAGLALAPGSTDPGVRSVYIADRKVDNGFDPNENDGEIYEVILGEGPLPTPTPTATPTPQPTATSEPTPTPEPTATLEPPPTPEVTPEPTATLEPSPTPEVTPEPTATLEPPPTATPRAEPTPGPNLAPNPGFEVDANADGAPDGWAVKPQFTRSAAVVRSGSFAGRHEATDGSTYTISGLLGPVPAGSTLAFAGWVDIPQPLATATKFQLKIEWRAADNTVIGNVTVKKYTAQTAGWDEASGTFLAPAGTASARVLMYASALVGTVYVDDIEVRRL